MPFEQIFHRKDPLPLFFVKLDDICKILGLYYF